MFVPAKKSDFFSNRSRARSRRLVETGTQDCVVALLHPAFRHGCPTVGLPQRRSLGGDDRRAHTDALTRAQSRHRPRRLTPAVAARKLRRAHVGPRQPPKVSQFFYLLFFCLALSKLGVEGHASGVGRISPISRHSSVDSVDELIQSTSGAAKTNANSATEAASPSKPPSMGYFQQAAQMTDIDARLRALQQYLRASAGAKLDASQS